MKTKEEIIEICMRPFDESDVEILNKRGCSLKYVSHPAVTRRLTEAFGIDWSFEIVETRDDVIKGSKGDYQYFSVLGKLTCNDESRMAWGGDDAQYKEIGDALKGAGSYSLRKCASLFGIGLHLWDGKLYGGVEYQGGQKQQKQQKQNPVRKNNTGRAAGDKLTNKQQSMILALAKEKKLSIDAISKRCLAKYGKSLYDLSKKQASEIITAMSSKKDD